MGQILSNIKLKSKTLCEYCEECCRINRCMSNCTIFEDCNFPSMRKIDSSESIAVIGN